MYVNSASHMHTSPPPPSKETLELSILCDSIVSWTSFVTYAEIFIVVSSSLPCSRQVALYWVHISKLKN